MRYRTSHNTPTDPVPWPLGQVVGHMSYISGVWGSKPAWALCAVPHMLRFVMIHSTLESALSGVTKGTNSPYVVVLFSSDYIVSSKLVGSPAEHQLH